MKPIIVALRAKSSFKKTGTKVLKRGQMMLMPKKPKPSKSVRLYGNLFMELSGCERQKG